MDANQFIDSPSGTIISTLEKHQAFVPNPLPPKIDYGAFMEIYEKAVLAIGDLNRAGQSMENSYLVISPLQRQEALRSSDMEGTYTTANALALAEANEERYIDTATIEVWNYIRAFNYAIDKIDKIPFSGRMIKGIHKTLLSNVSRERGISQNPGEYKQVQNFIGGKGRKIENARFVPAPPHEATEAMSDLEKYLNREEPNGIPPLIDAALMHYQFETIHPFSDGNGRVGRILIPIFLMYKKILDNPILFISPAVDDRKDEYVDSMLEVSKTGDWTQWIRFFMETILISCQNTNNTIARLTELHDVFRNRMSNAGMSVRNMSVLDELFISPVISVPQAAKLMQVTYAAAKNTVDRLVSLGILQELSFSSQPKQYICIEILNATDPDYVVHPHQG